MIKYILLLLLIPSTSAYELTGDNLIEPRYYEGNFLIMNEGYIPYAIFANDTNDYLGSIEHNQGMYVNESLNYSLFASYNEWRNLETVDYVEEKFNQWWLIFLLIGFFVICATFFIKNIWRQ